MRSVIASTALIIACLTAGVSGAFGQKAKRAPAAPAFQCTRTLTVNDWGVLLSDLKTANPDLVKRLTDDAELRKGQEDNLRQLLAVACQAVNDGVLGNPINRSELNYIRTEITAAQFDKIVNKGQVGAAPYSSITDQQIAGFYKIAGNNTKFEDYLKVKIELLKQNSPDPVRTITEDEREQAKNNFARISLTEAKSRLRTQKLKPDFWPQTNLQVKLQQAQFLSRLNAEKLAERSKVSEEEIDAYIASHPEFDTSKKRAHAQSVLDRALAGEDFAALANQYTEDPGNNGADGKQGGIYRDVAVGMMIPAFEKAALALEAGQVAPQLVETVYGFHVIKLERKGGSPDLKYDVRHILIATTVKDPANPNGRDLPARDFIRDKLESEKQAVMIEKIVADNKISIAPFPVGGPVVSKQPVKRTGVRRK